MDSPSTGDLRLCGTPLTNGFNWNYQFKFHPHGSLEPVVERLEKAFLETLDIAMTEWARTGFPSSKQGIVPLKPVAFEIAGRNFAWEPPQVPPSWKKPE